MIVRNEERNLSDCLAPVVGLFDEIVIVDTGSCDRTRDIAAQYTSQVYSFAWCDDFSAARNETLRRSLGDWIFWLDADDRVRGENVARLRALLDSLDDRPRIFLMDTVCWSRYECEGPRLITHPRLFRRHPELKWRGRVHEQLRPDAPSLGYEMLWSDVRIDHIGYQDDALRQRKLQRDVRLLRMDYAVDPTDPSILMHLGLTYARLGQHQEARKHLRRLEGDGRQPADWMRRVYGALAELSMREGDFHDALQVLARGLSLFPDDQNLLYMRAECLYEVDQFEAAKSTLLHIINNTTSRHYHGGAPGDLKRKLAPRKLGDVYRVTGAHAKAIDTFQEVLREFPDDTLTWYSLGRVYIDAGCGHELEAIAQRLRSCPDGHIFADLLLAGWYLERGQLNRAGRLIDQLIAEVPQMPLPRLLRVELLNRAGAPIEPRIQACRDLLRVHPGNVEALQLLAILENAQRRSAASTADQWCTSLVLGAGGPNGIIGV